ncbi:MAG TPA: CHRD domain-containing protein, partial [Puia sp.]|nr:CHRD domain-containing protein [Puia sp.]
ERTGLPVRILVAAYLLGALLSSCGKAPAGAAMLPGAMVNYAGTFVRNGSTDTSRATGAVAASYDPNTLTLTYSISWASLTSLPVAMHFHDNGPVIVIITGFPVATTGTISGACKLTAAQATDLGNGGIYAMIHTVSYNSGEIYAPLVRN